MGQIETEEKRPEHNMEIDGSYHEVRGACENAHFWSLTIPLRIEINTQMLRVP